MTDRAPSHRALRPGDRTTGPPLPDYPSFSTSPGAGAGYAPRLLAAFGEPREPYQRAAEVRRYAGLAPVTERSGHQCWVHGRLYRPTCLRQTFVAWAAQSIPHSYWAKLFYAQQRAKGSSHQAALRALAFTWIWILYRCWKDHTPDTEVTHLTALKRRGSPLLRCLRQPCKNPCRSTSGRGLDGNLSQLPA